MLFNTPCETLEIEDGTLIFHPAAYSTPEADSLFTTLSTTLPWQQDQLRIADRIVPLPRLQAWFGENGDTYTYSGLTLQPNPWTPLLLAVKQRTEDIAEHPFNSLLANFYRNENDSVGWHADNEKELGLHPVIASVSLGASRRFQLRHKTKAHLRFDLTLNHGDILVMSGTLQQYWLHQVLKEKAPTLPRISLTYRRLLSIEK